MDPGLFEQEMRAFEYYHSLRLVPGTWTVIRVDGRGFSRLTAERFDKPFDTRFHDLMVSAARAVFLDLQAIYAYTESDEISWLFPPGWTLFDRSVEKLVSISAASASAAFTHTAGVPAQFDSRIWVGIGRERVVDYFRWRQADAHRCALNGWAYWTLRREGKQPAAAAAELHQASTDAKRALLTRAGIRFELLPAWQLRGTGLYWMPYEKVGVDPRSGREVSGRRRRVEVDENLPVQEDYAVWMRQHRLA